MTAPEEVDESSMTAAVKQVEVDGKGWSNDVAPQDLTRKATRGALVSTVGQVGMLVLRTGSLMVLARLLLKEDFGLVNMVTAFTGFLALFRDAGLSMATVQRASITRAQVSTLFGPILPWAACLRCWPPRPLLFWRHSIRSLD